MALNRNKFIEKATNLSDDIAGVITDIAGSMIFLLINIAWFVVWILLNIGVFGDRFTFDKYPFNLLTMAVSLEAIILSTFVLMSQRRQSKITELRTELDYHADLQSEVDVKTVVNILERLAAAQGIDVSDLMQEMKDAEKKASRSEHIKA